LERDHHLGRVPARVLAAAVLHQLLREHVRGPARVEEPLEREHARVGGADASWTRQLPGPAPHRLPRSVRVLLAAREGGLPPSGAASRSAGGGRSSLMHDRPAAGLHRLAVATAVSTFVLLFVGGLVTSTGSGLAVPDWPLSFGQVFPPMVGGVLFEHGHRLAASRGGWLAVAAARWAVARAARPAVRALRGPAVLGGV